MGPHTSFARKAYICSPECMRIFLEQDQPSELPYCFVACHPFPTLKVVFHYGQCFQVVISHLGGVSLWLAYFPQSFPTKVVFHYDLQFVSISSWPFPIRGVLLWFLELPSSSERYTIFQKSFPASVVFNYGEQSR